MLYIDSIELHSACFVKIHVQKIITHNITCLWSLFMCSHSKYVNAVTVSTITFHAVSFLRTHTQLGTWCKSHHISVPRLHPMPDSKKAIRIWTWASRASKTNRVHHFRHGSISLIQFDCSSVAECRRVSDSFLKPNWSQQPASLSLQSRVPARAN